MKKKIETNIHSLATDLLNNKDSRSTQEWKDVTMQLYEKLCVLEYLEKQLEISQDTSVLEKKKEVEKSVVPEAVKEVEKPIEPKEIETDIEAIQKDPEPSLDLDTGFDIETAIAATQTEEIKTETEIEQEIVEIQDTPVEVIAEVETKAPQQPEKRQADDLQRFASTYKQTPVFSRKQTDQSGEEPRKNTNTAQGADKPKSLNDSLNRGLHIALNDRIAFINNLFEGSTQDFNRVLSQINTLDDFDSVHSFLEHQIKPDYSHWEGKEEYSERFIAIIEKKFS
ncbi:MAG TPA: hypothetical protein VKX30_05510 [Flavobacteriaceae bacterium]|nr:hypothetical protein [Flavobacteriaceae bacterium]